MERRRNAIKLTNVNKFFYLDERERGGLLSWFRQLFLPRSKMKKLHVINDMTMVVKKGETFGIIGRNGSGKSTLVKLMSGAYIPDSGEIIKNGSSMLMSLRVGMSPELTTRQNIHVYGSALGLKRSEINEKFDDIIAFAELEDFVDTKIRKFSNGMMARLSFSVALNAGADIMFLDEVFAVGDQKFKEKAIKVFEDNWLKGRTIIMVSHNMGNIKKYCDRVLYIKDGKKEYIGKPEIAVKKYLNDSKD